MESTFKEVAELWIRNIRCRVKESTYVKYVGVLKKHLIPEFGDCRGAEITTGLVEQMVRQKLGLCGTENRKKLSEKTIDPFLRGSARVSDALPPGASEA